SDRGWRRQKQPLRMQQCLKRPRGAARARVVAAEFLDQFLPAVHHAVTALDARLGREALAPFARDLESTRRLHRSVSCHTSLPVDDWSPRSESNGHALRAPASETG